jgi:hypothetical protein
MIKAIKKFFKVEQSVPQGYEQRGCANQCDYNEIMRPKLQSEKLCITTTTTTQLVLYATSCAFDHRDYTIKLGIISPEMDDWEAIAVVLAHYVFSGFEANISPKIVASFLENYCMDDIKKHFMFYYMHIATQYDIDINIHDFDADSFIALMDIEALAKDGERLNLKLLNNPFKEPFRSIWIKHLS